jgi:hypothetical protein
VALGKKILGGLFAANSLVAVGLARKGTRSHATAGAA